MNNKTHDDKDAKDRQQLTQELFGAVEIDKELLSQVTGGRGNIECLLTTPATSCVPPGTQCP